MKYIKYFSKIVITYCVCYHLSCITYRNFPEDKIGLKHKKEYSKLEVNIIDKSNFTLLGGGATLRRSFQKNSSFEEVELVDKMSGKNTFVQVTINYDNPSLAALVFGYISLGTFTFLPFWSQEDGYSFNMTVYREGNKIKTYNYEIRRHGFIWIVMIPISWVNFFTYSESEAFEAVSNQFFEDVKPLMKNLSSKENKIESGNDIE